MRKTSGEFNVVSAGLLTDTFEPAGDICGRMMRHDFDASDEELSRMTVGDVLKRWGRVPGWLRSSKVAVVEDFEPAGDIPMVTKRGGGAGA